MRGAVAAGHPLTAAAGARILAEGGNAVDACVAATSDVLGGREHADRPRRRRLHAHAHRVGSDRGARLLRRAAGPRLRRRGGRDADGRHRVRQGNRRAVLRRRAVVRRSRDDRRAFRSAPRARPASLARALPAGDRGRARRGSDRRGARASARDPRSDPPSRRGRAADLRPRAAAGARRGAGHGRSRGHAGAARARGRRRVLPRRPVQGHAPLRRRGRRRAHGQGSRLVQAAALQADSRRVPGHGVRHVSAELGGRRADRVRAADPRPARPARGSRLGSADRPPRRGDAGVDPGARRLLHRRAPGAAG